MTAPAKATVAAPALPTARGPLSSALIGAIAAPVGAFAAPPVAADDPLADDDLHLALYACYELHYRSFAGVDSAWEWEPSLLAFRRDLEGVFESALLDAVRPVAVREDAAVAADIAALAGAATGPSLSRYLHERGTLDELREFAVHRSPYQLKEADPHTWAIPRLAGAAKAALVQIQSEEYGGGHEPAMHSTLFATTLRALGLDDTYGAYLDVVPGFTLATSNLISLFGLHRRWRGALVGHLALFEMTSVVPMARYSDAIRRLGVDHGASEFYDVHVEADADHERVAAAMVDAAVAGEPHLASDIVFGAAALMLLEDRFTRRLLDAWAAGRTSLLSPLR